MVAVADSVLACGTVYGVSGKRQRNKHRRRNQSAEHLASWICESVRKRSGIFPLYSARPLNETVAVAHLANILLRCGDASAENSDFAADIREIHKNFAKLLDFCLHR